MLTNEHNPLQKSSKSHGAKSAALRLVTPPEHRNPRTGLPEQAYYRPPDPKNVKAAKNALGAMFVGFLIAVPFWLLLIEEKLPEIFKSIERTVGK